MPVQFEKDPLPIINEGERHVPAALLVDCSGSMSGKPIQELNEGLVAFGQALHEDSLALGRAEVTIISFSSNVDTVEGFRPGEQYEAPVLSANGLTALNEAIIAGLDAIEARKAEYKSVGVNYYRPWLFLLTDGVPTDTNKEAEAKRRLRTAIEQKKVVYIPMGIGSADTAKLQEYYPENYVDENGAPKAKIVLKARTDNFKEAFVWLSKSIGVVSNSNPDLGQVQLPQTPSNIVVGI